MGQESKIFIIPQFSLITFQDSSIGTIPYHSFMQLDTHFESEFMIMKHTFSLRNKFANFKDLMRNV
jgi:hypothetical protein